MDVSGVTYGKKNVKRSLGHFIMGKSLSLIVGLGFFLIVARGLGIEEFGFYIILVALLEIMGLFSSFGSYFIAQRYVPELMHQKAYAELKKLLIFLLTFRIVTLVIFLVLFFGLSEYFLGYFDVIQYLWVFQLYLLVMFFENLARFIEIIFDSLLLQGYTQISILFRTVLRFVAVLVLYMYSVENTFDLSSLIFIEFVTGLLGVLVVFILLIRFVVQLPKSFAGCVVELDYIRYFNFARPGYISDLIGLTYSVHTLKLVMIKLFGASEVALFGFTSTLIAMLTRYMPPVLLVGMIRPLFITAYNEGGDYSKLHRLTHIVIKINLFFILPFIIFLSVFSEELVILLGGEKFENGGSYLFLFSIFMLIQIHHVILSQLNIAHEGGNILLKATLYSALGIVLGFISIGILGEYAILCGLILSEVIFCWVLFNSLSKQLIVSFTSFSGGKSFFIACLLSFFILNVNHYIFDGAGILYLSLQFGILLLVFLASLYLIKPFTDGERLLIKKVLPIPYFCF